MDDDALVERLTTVRGVGRWTVEMLLMFRLGRADVLPVGDLGVRKGFARTFRTRGLPSPTPCAAGGAVAALPECGELVSVAGAGAVADDEPEGGGTDEPGNRAERFA